MFRQMTDFLSEIETIFEFRRKQEIDEPKYARAAMHLELVYECLLGKYGLKKVGCWMDLDDWINEDESNKDLTDQCGVSQDKSKSQQADLNGKSESGFDCGSSQINPSEVSVKGVDPSSPHSISRSSANRRKVDSIPPQGFGKGKPGIPQN